MSSRTEEPKVAPQGISVDAMPPLEVTHEGIPEHEHLPVASRRRRLEMSAESFAKALVGVLAVVLVVTGALLVIRAAQPAMGHMGLTTQAWQDYRAGERASLAAMLPAPMGLTTQAWQDYRAGERAVFVNPYAGHMGLSTQAWQDYRAGEQAAFVNPYAGHMGLTTQAWQDYRAGEQAAFVNPYAGHMGLTTQAWQDYRGGERAGFVPMAAGYLALEAAGEGRHV
jgi:hypothetical protein